MIVAVVDVIRGLFTVADPVVKDDTATEPYKVQPDRLYVYPIRTGLNQLALTLTEDGFFDDAHFRVRILYTLANHGEPRAIKADRDLSIALDAALVDVLTTLQANTFYPPGSGNLWHHLIVDMVRPDFARSNEARGFAVDVDFLLSAGAADAVAGSGSSA
jgi:hypothetical protein